MTHAATAIAEMEDPSKSFIERAAIQSRHAMDRVFRDVLLLTYDPYEQFGTPLSLPEPNPIMDAEVVDEALDHMWLECASALRSGVRYARAVELWSGTPIWPVIERVLRKRFVGVSFVEANSVWGTLPLFDAGDVGDGAPTYPCFAIPVFSRHRRLVVVRPVTYLPDSRARIDFFDQTGQCCETLIGDVLPRRLRRIDWDPFLTPGTVFENGIVLDGWIDDDQQTFCAFDCVPLTTFREQRLTTSFAQRVQVFNPLRAEELEGLCVAWPHVVVDDEDLTLNKAMKLLERSRGNGVLGIEPNSVYPYRASHAWTWLYKPGTK